MEHNPTPTSTEIEWILQELSAHMSDGIKFTLFTYAIDVQVRKEDVLAAWTGIRPLVRDPAAKNTQELVRNHMLNVSPSGLVTIAGGKWTTYRAMAQETIDTACYLFSMVSAIV